MPDSASSTSRLMVELASQMTSYIADMFEGITVSRNHPIADFPLKEKENYLYVLYSANGMPLFVGTVVESMDKRKRNAAMKEIQNFAGSGFATSFRVIQFESEQLAVHVENWVKDLFQAALPFANVIAVNRSSTTRRAGGDAEQLAAPKRRRGRPRKSDADAVTSTGEKRGRGRPRKSESSSASTTAGKKRRGRPRKNTEPVTAAPAKQRGRPRKSDLAAPAAAAGTKRRGRPRKDAAPATAATKGPGRPRKSSAAPAAGVPAATGTKGRGRPRKSDGSTANPTSGKRRGKTKKSAGKGRASSPSKTATKQASASPKKPGGSTRKDG